MEDYGKILCEAYSGEFWGEAFFNVLKARETDSGEIRELENLITLEKLMAQILERAILNMNLPLPKTENSIADGKKGAEDFLKMDKVEGYRWFIGVIQSCIEKYQALRVHAPPENATIIDLLVYHEFVLETYYKRKADGYNGAETADDLRAFVTFLKVMS